MKYMLDSNVFDSLNMEDIEKLKKWNHEYYITSVQFDEINNIPDNKNDIKIVNKKKIELLGVKEVLLNTWVWGHFRFNDTRWGDGIEYEKILSGQVGSGDALIAEAAKIENCIIVTNDKKMYNRLVSLDYNVLYFHEFYNLFKEL